MINILLIIILTQAEVPGIHIDEDGFVTVIENLDERSREEQRIQIMKEAEKYYDGGRFPDVSIAIEKYERVLNSGIELARETHLTVVLRLSRLYQRYASGGTWQDGGHAESIWVEWNEISQTGNIPDEFIERAHSIVEAPEHKEALMQAIAYNNEATALLKDDDGIKLARLYFTNADIYERIGTQYGLRESLSNFLRARQAARSYLADATVQAPEAVKIADAALKNVTLLLRYESLLPTATELIQDYDEDEVLVTAVQSLLKSID